MPGEGSFQPFLHENYKELFYAKTIENRNCQKYIKCNKTKIKIKPEVVPINEKYDFTKKIRKNYLTPIQWNKFLEKKNNKIIDARKPFEYEVGTFKKAINPNTKNFREFK